MNHHPRNIKYLWSILPGLLVIGGNLMGGWWVATNFIFSFGILALLENFVKENRSNESDAKDWFPDGLLVIHVLVQIGALSALFYAVASHPLTHLQFLLMVLSTGVNSGASAIVIAHELVHRKDKFLNLCGRFLLLSACNIYFYIDHLKVHHKWVGTPKDPASSRYGESLYAFFLRTTVQQTISAFNVEAKRLREIGALTWTPRNYVIGSAFLIIAILTALYFYSGITMCLAFLLQGLVANFLLEYTNYIEHYGLSRKENERVTEIHSWQTDKVISRYFLIDLSRHADHHYYASKPYHTLDSYENSPVLPGGYVSMIYYALIPPLFFRKMHRVLELYSGRH